MRKLSMTSEIIGECFKKRDLGEQKGNQDLTQISFPKNFLKDDKQYIYICGVSF